MAKYKAENERDRCVACGVCVKTCPRDAISIYRGCYATVDENLCIGCGICEKNCPAGPFRAWGSGVVLSIGASPYSMSPL